MSKTRGPGLRKESSRRRKNVPRKKKTLDSFVLLGECPRSCRKCNPLHEGIAWVASHAVAVCTAYGYQVDAHEATPWIGFSRFYFLVINLQRMITVFFLHHYYRALEDTSLAPLANKPRMCNKLIWLFLITKFIDLRS